jgi:chemotaxis protein MotB
MAEKKASPTIVIKKITIVAGGHGGSWKVALADFMTALMCFFLVMWLLNQTEETKKAVSDYFSSPSIIEYNYSTFGVEITLEKLFLDIVNEPLKAFQSFMEPMDKAPNMMDFGSASVVTAFMADKMGDVAKNFQVGQDGIEFDIPDKVLFMPGTATPSEQYVTIMDRLKTITTGLQDSNVDLQSRLFNQSVAASDPATAQKVAAERLDLIQKRIDASFTHATNTIDGKVDIRDKKGFIEGQSQRPQGMIHFSVHQKAEKADGKKFRPLDRVFSKSTGDNMSVYDNFVKQAVDNHKKSAQ